MQGAGDQFLPVPDSPRMSTGAMPRATLATRCLTLRMASDAPTRRAIDRLQGSRNRPRCRGQGAAAAAGAGAPSPPHCRGHHRAELLEIHGLGEVVEGARAQGLHGVFRRTVGGHHHAALAPLLVAQVLQQFHAKAVGQAHVADDHVEAFGLQLLACFEQGGGGIDAVALAQQGQLVQGAQVGFVVDHQDGCGRCVHGHITPRWCQTGRPILAGARPCGS